MRTRTLSSVVLAGLLLLAGCGGIPAPGTGTTTPHSTQGPTDSGTTTVSKTSPATTKEGHYRSYEISVRQTAPEEIVRNIVLSREEMADRLVWRRDRFLTPLFGNGRAVRIVVSNDPEANPGPFENGTLVRANGTIYSLNRQVVGQRDGPGYEMRLSGPLPSDHDEYDRAKREAVAFETLSTADEGVFTHAAPPPDDRRDGFTIAAYTYVFPNETTAANATLVDGNRHYVRYGDDLYRIRSRERLDEAVRYAVEYDRRRVTDSASALFERRQESLVTPLTKKTAPPRVYDLVTRVLFEGREEWTGTSPVPPRFTATEDWVQDHPPGGRSAYIRYDGELYELRVEKVVE
jgi:hypothetical protein